ncbi:MAG: SAM-dependent chlorinase/fluorinase [Solobacterium sp.]|nr:SAM-dependent chlorinase/fluorinase [Solobacterium sp.]
MNTKPLDLLVFQTDFTYKEGAVAAMYGVVRSVSRDVEIITATHDLPQFDIWSASYRLMQYVRFWPKGTVFVSVVDPGVGSSRKACCAVTKDGYYIVTPDNGTLTHVERVHGIQEIREIDEETNMLKSDLRSSVFHGRDLFGYCAARLAAGVITYEQVGKAYDPKDIVRLEIKEPEIREGRASGILEIDDPNFGNVWTNIPTEDFIKAGFDYGEMVHVTLTNGEKTIYAKDTKFVKTFADVGKGEPLIYNNELTHISLALSQGSFLDAYHAGFGSSYRIIFTKK